MTELIRPLISLYYLLFFKHAKLALAALIGMTLFFAWHSQSFRLDASGETLVLENDPALAYYQDIRKRYGSDDYLILTFSPSEPLFSKKSLNNLTKLTEQLEKISGVEQIHSILSVPLFNSPKQSLSQVQEQTITLASDKVNLAQATTELKNSSFYKNMLLSPDFKTTAVIISLAVEPTLYQLQTERRALLDKQLIQKLTVTENKRLKQLKNEINQAINAAHKQQKQVIAAIRHTYKLYKQDAKLHLGGVPMITSDSIDYIKHDLKTFGVGVIVFLIVLLTIAFTRLHWVVLPMLTCLIASIVMLGILALADWPVTVVSANFISLMLIITLSLTIHLIVRYQELHWHQPQLNQHELVFMTLKKKFMPCLFTTLTTMVAFTSLIISQIKPVIDFGWMMTLGMAVSFILVYSFFPAALVQLKPGKPANQINVTEKLTEALGNWVNEHPKKIIFCSLSILLLALWGCQKLSVENRFIDYFKESTEIYQGMALIDKQLGGTTPLDVIINAPKNDKPPQLAQNQEFEEELLEDDLLAELLAEETTKQAQEQSLPEIAKGFWFNPEQIKQIGKYHTFLDSIEATGKVLSLSSSINLLSELKPEIKDDLFTLSLIYEKLPDDLKAILFNPYISSDGEQIRFSIRVFESDPNLNRQQLIKTIKTGLTEQFSLKAEQIEFSGMLVLYNNLLSSLFNSQIMTLGAVFIIILIMFIILFRNVFLATIALIPNLCAAFSILGLMGWLHIPLDLMTITIAAICIGIAVDDSIHYVYRIKNEFANSQNYQLAVIKSHKSIGRAMYYTSITVTLGFSILTLSNFIPSIYFGVLTGLSMIIALFANLTLLPVLITWLKPLGKEASH
jgi:predicted RND superfamily exporter protein